MLSKKAFRCLVTETPIPRPIEWRQEENEPGPTIRGRYRQMMQIRNNHPGLRSSNFYPRDWNDGWTQLNLQGFGIDRARNVVVYHRWGEDGGERLERFYVVLNFSKETRHVAFEVPDSGPWRDLISGASVNANDGRLHVDIGSNWGAIYYQKYD